MNSCCYIIRSASLLTAVAAAVFLSFSNAILAEAKGNTITVPPGSGDMGTAIQAALNKVGSGGQVLLQSGTYNHATVINIPSGVTLSGVVSTVLNATKPASIELVHPEKCCFKLARGL